MGSSAGRCAYERIGDVNTKRTSLLATTYDVKYRLPVSKPLYATVRNPKRAL